MRLIHSKEIVLYNFVCVFLNVFFAQNQTIPPGFNSLPIGTWLNVHSVSHLPPHGMMLKVLSAMLRESSTEVAELRCQEWTSLISNISMSCTWV